MKRNDAGEIIITDQEAEAIKEFIRSSLYRAWDRYTDNVICEGTSWEDGMRQMDPEMYDIADQLNLL